MKQELVVKILATFYCLAILFQAMYIAYSIQ